MRCALALGAALLIGSAGPALATKITDAELAFSVGEDQKALSLFTEALEDPGLGPAGRAAALNGRGEVRAALRDTQAAIDDFTAALALVDDVRTRASIHFSRAEAYNRLRKDAEAIADYGETIRLAPDFVGAHLARASLYRRLERREEALADVEAELKRYPNSTRAIGARAELLGLPPPPYVER